MARPLFIIAIAVMLASLIGCTGSTSNPVTGDNPNLTNQQDVTQPTAQAELNNGHSLFGYYDVTVDPGTMKVEFTPLRTVETHFNLVGILENGSSKISITSPPTIEDGMLTVGIGITHPFSAIPNLTGFDVKGILITKGTKTGWDDTAIRTAGPAETRLANADGMTRWWNPAEFLNSGMTGYTQGKLGGVIDPSTAAILNGYKLFADDLDANETLTDLNTETRAMFSAGTTNSRTYVIDLASGLKFNYAVDASWAPPTVKPPVNLPDDFPINANQSEPWYIKVVEDNNNLWYEDGEHGGNANYTVTVYDWQGVDDFGSVHFEESNGLFHLHADAPFSGTTYSKTYKFDVPLPDLTSAEPLDILISVEVPGDYDSSLTGVTAPLNAYSMHRTLVSDTNPVFNTPPVALMEATTATDITAGGSVSFDASASYDTDGIIEDYQWDFNGDGIYGDTYDSGDDIMPTKVFGNTGTFQVKVKVVDNNSSSTKSDPVWVNVSADTNTPPVAVGIATTETTIEEDNNVSFDGTGSYDPDGTVVEYKWDFNGDGNYSDTFTGPAETPTKFFGTPGVYQVDLKVKDNENATGVLSTKIEVTVLDVPNVLPTANMVETSLTDISLCGTVSFDASLSTDTDGTIESYLWDFNGDDVFGDAYDSGTDVSPAVSFDTVGSFNIKVKVIDDEGGEDISDPVVVNVTNDAPSASFIPVGVTLIESGEPMEFDASSSTDPNTACGDVLAYSWDFDGDEVFGDSYDSGTDVNPIKIYNTPGVYDVQLKVTDANSGEDFGDEDLDITVQNAAPVACAEITTPGPYYFWNSDIEFDATCSTDIDGTIQTVEWDLGADGSYEQAGWTAIYQFDTAGDYTMQCRVWDDMLATSLLTEPISFHIFDDSNVPPTVDKVTQSRTTSLQGSAAEAVTLGVEFTDPAPPGDTHTFLWTAPAGSFDDATSATPIWTPPAGGAQEVDITVRVTDLMGMWDEGTIHQWVTTYPIITSNANSPTGKLISMTLGTAFGAGNINPTQFSDKDTYPQGNVTYCNFWATWCGPCVGEMPHLKSILQGYAGQDYLYLAVDVGETVPQVENWVNNNNGLASYWVMDPSNSYYSQSLGFLPPPDQGFIPTHILSDRDGYVRYQHVGAISSPSQLTTIIDQLL